MGRSISVPLPNPDANSYTNGKRFPLIPSYAISAHGQCFYLILTDFTTLNVRMYELNTTPMRWQQRGENIAITKHVYQGGDGQRSYDNSCPQPPYSQLLTCQLNGREWLIQAVRDQQGVLKLCGLQPDAPTWCMSHISYPNDDFMHMASVTVRDGHQEVVLLPSDPRNGIRHLVCFEPYMPSISKDVEQSLLENVHKTRDTLRNMGCEIALIGEAAERLLYCDKLLSGLPKSNLPIALMKSAKML